MRDLQVFPRVRSPTIRRELVTRLLSCERILTFKSFRYDMILLEGCYRALRDLFPIAGTTLQSSCEASFRHDPQYFRINYIDLWLRVMRKYPYLSDHASASVKTEVGGSKPIPYRKSEIEVSHLVSFAKSRGFWTYDIANPLLRGTNETHLEPASAFFPELSCKEGNIRRNHRCSHPRACDFEQAWKHLSLQSVFRAQKQPRQKYPTAFAVIRDIVRCFLGTTAPEEIDNPRRILQVHQYVEQQNDIDGVGDESLDSWCRIENEVDSDAMQGISNDPANIPGSASSIYSRPARSPSLQTSPRYEPSADGVSCTGEAIVGLYEHIPDVPSIVNDTECHEFKSDVHEGLVQANESSGDALMLLSPDTRSNSPASNGAEALDHSPQSVEVNSQREPLQVVKDADRVAGTHNRLHEAKKDGYRTNPHRIEKPQHYKEKKRLKQQQRHLTQVLQGHDNESRMTPSQREFINLIDLKRTEVDDVSNTLSAEEVPAVSSPELAISQPIHDDRGINMPHSANQRYTNDDGDDVQTGTRKAEEQMRGAEDAVNETYDDEPACQTQQTRGDETGDGINGDDGIHIPANTMIELFPGGPIEPTPDSSIGHHEPTQRIEALAISEKQAETIDGGTSLPDKRKAIYHERGSVHEAGNSAIPRLQVNASREEESSAAVVSEEPVISMNPRESMFPAGALTPGSLQQVTPGGQSSSAKSTLSKKRNLPTEYEDAGVHLRAPKISNQTQLHSWEPFKGTVDAIGRVWGDLDHARIYVTSSVDIGELSVQQHPNHVRLWSWLKEDRELFDRQISLLRKKFGFQVICSDPQGRRYRGLGHMEYWNAYFDNNQSGYWLAVLTQWRSAGPSREKVRKTYDDRRLQTSADQ